MRERTSLPIAPSDLTDLRAITLFPEYAALVANGDKLIETRPRRCHHRGPVAIHAGVSDPAERGVRWVGQYMVGTWTDRVVHAVPCDCDEDEETVGDRCMEISGGYRALLSDGGAFAPQFEVRLHAGSIVAVATLVDCVPMVEPGNCVGPSILLNPEVGYPGPPWSAWGWQIDHWRPPTGDDTGIGPINGTGWTNVTDQLPFGEFAPGRFALLLADVTPLPEPVPCRGNQAVPWRVPDDVAERVRGQLAGTSGVVSEDSP